MKQYRSIYKWITFAIILLLVSVIVIPSISHNIVTASNTSKTKDINYLTSGNFLLIILKKIFGMRIFLHELLYHFSVKIEYHGDPPIIRHPLVYLINSVYGSRIYYGITFWLIISYLLNFHWTWDDISPNW